LTPCWRRIFPASPSFSSTIARSRCSVLHLVGLLLRSSEDLAQTRAEILLATLHARKTRDRRLRIVENDRDVCAELSENWSDDTFRLVEHRDQQVLGFDLLMLVSFSQLDGRLDCFLSTQGEFI